ncbi:kinase-like domain-containing protein [Roridomyces roridus]|uniref:Kinase-like domain-containing protein n=1 Tax=Roridomyces roridus TaxID=1738132 RepID=A0AAD7FWM9_9AGAR|nr:kinase-like domain-containing protein [Roridomyces roridus]
MDREEFESKAQICIDVIHGLLTILRDNTEQGLFRDDAVFLVNLCQRAMLLPKSFVSSDRLLIEDNAPIDTGASSEVYRGKLGHTEVAVKSFRLYFRTGYLVRKRFIKEALILEMAQHPNVLRFMSIVHEKSEICIITPWHARGHIMNYTAAVPSVPRKELLEQVADGLHFLSQYNIVHGDLKGRNILIDDDGKALIADLGLSFIEREQDVTAASKSSTCGGTSRWMAPERLVPSAFDRPSPKATASSDVYSFGMLMLEVYTGAPPWASQPAEMVVLLDVVRNIRPLRPTDGSIDDAMWRIVEQCWAHQPEERPTILQVYNLLACIP